MLDEMEDELYRFAIHYFDSSIGDWVTIDLHDFPDPMLQLIPCDDETSE